MKQTAVEWLYNHLFPKQLDGFSDEEWNKIDLAFNQAKKIEEENICDAYNEGLYAWDNDDDFIGIDYYNKKFKNK